MPCSCKVQSKELQEAHFATKAPYNMMLSHMSSQDAAAGSKDTIQYTLRRSIAIRPSVLLGLAIRLVHHGPVSIHTAVSNEVAVKQAH